ncbi:MAG TPA: flagellar biosynthesis protein FlhF [Planctomycetaceae bacterium]|nr:flagellar biosynthesis protein FlhF [Planctomycetaceae bacterium]
MEVVTFRASSLQEALQQVREQLGPDASIVNTREVKSGALGLFGKPVVEVEAQQTELASYGPAPSQPKLDPERGYKSSRPAAVTAPTTGETPISPWQVEQPHSQTAATEQDHSHPFNATDRAHQRPNHQAISLESSVRLQTMASDPNGKTNSPSTLGSATDLSPAAIELTSDLLAEGFLPQQASKLVRQVIDGLPGDQHEDAYVLRGTAGRLIAERLNTSGPLDVGEDRARVIAFVGATGVGKTTTLAKIAAGLRFDVGLDIGLITIDTFRLGAVDQLLQYAELLSSPLEVVNAPDEMAGAMQRLRECDTVLIDTAGRSPRDKEQLSILGEFLEVAAPDSVQLVVSSTSSPAVAREAVERYSNVNASNMILSKIDETVQLGAWYGMLSDCPLPVSYITHGQQVPQDITIATPRRLSSLLLSNSQHQA